MGRVAGALSDDPRHYRELRELLLDQRFIPAGRVQSAMGSTRQVTPYNCYVSGTIPDSFTERDNPENSSIMDRARDAARTMRMGGGIGYDWSTLRPKGALIKKLMSQASGPLEFMEIFDAVCRATSSSGNRRGAQMGVLRVDHPDIWDFIHVKQDQTTLTGFNISIGVTDEFMQCLESGKPFPLRWGGEVYRTVDPQELWEAAMRSTWDWGEPGVLFLDTINRMNNLWYCETIAATNPCGEQPLPPHGACLLGSFNLVKYLSHQGGSLYSLDLEWLESDVETAVRALDNVVDKAIYPLEEQAHEARSKRRMGLGVMALANALEACGMPYGSATFLQAEARVLDRLNRAAYMASTKLAAEKGVFPYYDADKYLQGAFVRQLDEEVQWAMRKHGMRNSHLTSIAPTGTISMTADNVSSGVEPVYRWQQQRRVKMRNGDETVDVPDYGFARLQVRGKRAAFGEVTPAEHLAVLTTAQRFVDSAVSKTINTDGSVPWDDFKSIYRDAWAAGAKGCTTFNKDGKRAGLFRETPEPRDLPFPAPVDATLAAYATGNAGASCEIDPATGRRSCE